MYIDKNSYDLACPEIKEYYDLHKYEGFIIRDSNGCVHTTHNIYPQLFCNKIIMMNSLAFSQTSIYLANNLRPFVLSLIPKHTKITCIGGESYCYGILSQNEFVHYTNSQIISDDCNYNAPDILSDVINYSKPELKVIYQDFCILNVSCIVRELLEYVCKNVKTVLIISCHENDFQKKRKFMPDISERHFIKCEITGIEVSINMIKLIR